MSESTAKADASAKPAAVAAQQDASNKESGQKEEIQEHKRKSLAEMVLENRKRTFKMFAAD